MHRPAHPAILSDKICAACRAWSPDHAGGFSRLCIINSQGFLPMVWCDLPQGPPTGRWQASSPANGERFTAKFGIAQCRNAHPRRGEVTPPYWLFSCLQRMIKHSVGNGLSSSYRAVAANKCSTVYWLIRDVEDAVPYKLFRGSSQMRYVSLGQGSGGVG